MADINPWDLERRLWLEGAAAYGALLDPVCAMVFAEVGVLEGASIAESLRGAPRWAEVEMEEAHVARPTDDLAVLAYRAAARREGEGSYRAWCTSTWRRAGESWRLVQHQQTPA